MNLTKLGLNWYQRQLVNTGIVWLEYEDGKWFACDDTGIEVVGSSAPMVMKDIEVKRLEQQLAMVLDFGVIYDEFNEFNDDGPDWLDEGDMFAW